MTLTRTRKGTFLLFLGLVTILMGCSGSDETTSGPPPVATEGAGWNQYGATDRGEFTPIEELASKKLGKAEDSDLGMILIGPYGEAVYIYIGDEPDKSNCTGDCIVMWPPMEGDRALAEGVAELFGSIIREDGLHQITFNGHPLYLFADDDTPGDKKGYGVDDQWFLISPEGEPIMDAGS